MTMNGRGVEPYETRNLIAPWVGRGGAYPDIEYGAPVGGIMIGWAREEARRTPQPVTVHGRALRGYATRWNKVHKYKGRLEALARGCFARSLTGDTTIRFLVSHREPHLIATTADRLELCQDEHGLAFNLPLRGDENSRNVADLVESRSMVGMSVCYRVVRHETLNIDGTDVRMIRDAHLDEISLVKHGAVKEAHCSIVKIGSDRPLREVCDRGALAADAAACQMQKALQQYKETVYELLR